MAKESENKEIKMISKGYRLKPETHKLIKMVKQKLSCSHDKVLSDAIKLYGRMIKKSKLTV